MKTATDIMARVEGCCSSVHGVCTEAYLGLHTIYMTNDVLSGRDNKNVINFIHTPPACTKHTHTHTHNASHIHMYKRKGLPPFRPLPGEGVVQKQTKDLTLMDN